LPDVPGLDLVGSFARAFDLISSEYGWDDEVILDKTLKRIRQILAAITLRRKEEQRQQRLIISWQTRSLAMVMAAAGGNAHEDIMQFASNLTIDNEEYEQFNEGNSAPIKAQPKLPVHASTQDEAAQANFDAAADRNNFDMLALFGQGMSTPPPGQ
jgi:hypothetical protein